MESNWRYDVYGVGMMNSNWRLCAWLSAPYEPGELIVSRTGNPNGEIWLYTGPDSLPTFYVDLGPVPGFPHFPYGHNVSPD